MTREDIKKNIRRCDGVRMSHEVFDKLADEWIDEYLLNCAESGLLEKKQLIKHNNLIEYNTVRDSTSIEQEDWGVHASHCCKEHGCKYGDDDCPVVLRLIEQKYPCEDCREIEQEEQPESKKNIPTYNFAPDVCDPTAEHCCCKCVHQVSINKHPQNNKPLKGSILDRICWGCNVFSTMGDSNIIIAFDRMHSYGCEMFNAKQVKE